MDTPSHVLALVRTSESVVHLHADIAGLDRLIQALTFVRDKTVQGICEHEHLMSHSWGGHDLSEHSGPENGELVHHLKIFGWTDDWAAKHGFTNPQTA